MVIRFVMFYHIRALSSDYMNTSSSPEAPDRNEKEAFFIFANKWVDT